MLDDALEALRLVERQTVPEFLEHVPGRAQARQYVREVVTQTAVLLVVDGERRAGDTRPPEARP